MTVSCWKENPIERPIVDKLLKVLEVAGEQWRPRRGWLPTLSPQDDGSPTLCAVESDSQGLSESEDDHVTTESPTSYHSPHSFATKSPVFATAPFTLAPFPPVPPPPPAEDKASPATPDKEDTDPPHNDLSGDSRSSGKEYKPIPGEEVTNEVSTSRTGKEDPEKPIGQISITPETEDVQRTPPALSGTRFHAPLSAGKVEGTTPIEPGFLTPKGKADTALTALPQLPPKSTFANRTLSTEDPIPPTPPELKRAPITAEASDPLISPQSSATQASVPTPSPIDPAHPPPVSTPLTTKSRTPPRSRLTSAALKKDLTNPAVQGRPGGEESTFVSFVVGEDETRSRSVRSTRGEELESISVTSRKEETEAGVDRSSIHEERRPTLAPSKREGIRQAPVSPSPQLKPTPTTSRDIANEVVPVDPTLVPKEINVTSFGLNDVPPEPTLAPSQDQAVRSISPGSRKEVSSSNPTSFPTSGEGDDHHTHTKRPEDDHATTESLDPVAPAKGKVEVRSGGPGWTAVPPKKERALTTPPSWEWEPKLGSPTTEEPETSPRISISCFRDLVEVCEASGILPRSCIVSESKVNKLGLLPVSYGGYSKVWVGEYGEEREAVAIKVLRQHKAKAQRIKAVRSLHLFAQTIKLDYLVEFLPGGRYPEAPISLKHPAIYRRHHGRCEICYYITLGGWREYCRVLEKKQLQSIETGTHYVPFTLLCIEPGHSYRMLRVVFNTSTTWVSPTAT